MARSPIADKEAEFELFVEGEFINTYSSLAEAKEAALENVYDDEAAVVIYKKTVAARGERSLKIEWED